MNKFISKIIGATLAIAMMIGVGIGVASNYKTASPVVAAKGDLLQTANFTSGSSPSGWTVNSDGYYSGNGLKFSSTSHYVISPSIASNNLKDVKVGVKAGHNGGSGSVLTITALDANNNVLSGGTVSGTIIPTQAYTTAVNSITEQFVELSTTSNIAKIKVAMTSKTKNLGVKVINIYDNAEGGNPTPKISFSKEEIAGEEGENFSFTYSDTDLTSDIVWSPASNATNVINYEVNASNKTVTGTLLKEGTVTLTATSGTASDSIVFNVNKHITNRIYTVTGKSSVSQTGDTITGSQASYSQTYGTVSQATAGNSMTLSITGLTKKVSINKLVLSMRSNANAGAGSISVKIDNKEADFIAGTSAQVGAGFNTFGDNKAYSSSYKDVTWDNLSYVAKSSIEIKIYCIGTNSLYCESFDIFFEETENADVVTELTVSPRSWTGYDSQMLEVEDFTVSVTTNGTAGTPVDYKFLGIGYMNGNDFVARDANFVYGYPQVADTRLCWKAEYPTTPGGSTYLYAYVTLNVSADTVSSVAISGKMDKTSYFTNDEWERYGLITTAVYASGNEQNVTASASYKYYSDSAMANEAATPAALGTGNKTVYVKATYEGISNAVGYAQEVSISIEHGSLITDPLTVDEAIDKGKDLVHETTKEYYIRGIVAEIDTGKTTDTYATFYFQDSFDNYSFEAFKMPFDSNCDNHEDLKVGAEVLIKCTIRKYSSSTIENGQNNGSILSITFAKPALENISLNKEKVYLEVNEQFALTAAALPLGAELGTVEWSSSNSGVATVDQTGKVTAVALGSAVITAKSGDITATCNVVVSTKATLQYTGDSSLSANVYTDAELTQLLGLNTELFTVSYDKNGASTEMNLNPEGAIRMYATKATTNGNKFTVAINKNYTIDGILISFAKGYSSTAEISSKSGIVSGDDGCYNINDAEFTVFNNNSSVDSNTQVRITKIEIFYRGATASEQVSRLNTQTTLSYRYSKDANDVYTYSDIVMRFGGNISKNLWNELENITGFGVILMDGEMVKAEKDVSDAMTDMVSSTVTTDLNEHLAIDYFVPVANMNETIGSDSNNYFWNLCVSINSAEMNKSYTAVAYIKLGDEYVLMNFARESVETLALDYLTNRNCDATTAGGSLKAIVDNAQ